MFISKRKLSTEQFQEQREKTRGEKRNKKEKVGNEEKILKRMQRRQRRKIECLIFRFSNLRFLIFEIRKNKIYNFSVEELFISRNVFFFDKQISESQEFVEDTLQIFFLLSQIVYNKSSFCYIFV